jgi:hypothetical protein
MKRIKWIRLFSAALAIAALSSGTAEANPADADISIALNSPSPVTDGTLVDITGTVLCDGAHGQGFCDTDGKPAASGSIRIQQVQDEDGNPMSCADLANDGVDFVKIAQDPDAPDTFGQYTYPFDTTGLGGQIIGFRVHYVTGGGPHALETGFSDCADLEITLADADPLPDGTTSFTQGYFGSAPAGEAIVALLVGGTACSHILDALTLPIADSQGPGVIDCSSENGRNDLAGFLVGTVGTEGGNNDGGFLPSGFHRYSLAAQTITLLLNLGAVLTGADIPMQASFFLNIDPVVDLLDGTPGDTIDPVYLNAGELAEFCEDVDSDQVCDPGSLLLSALGAKVAALDAAGTRVQEVLDAALSRMLGGVDPQTVNGVDLSAGDLTTVIGLINESYDEGTSTAFVTAYDAD